MADHIKIGTSELFKRNLERLHRAWREERLILFVGAGVSSPYGLPNWNDLIVSLMIDAADPGHRAGDWSGYHPHYAKALGSWLMDRFRFNPVALARLFANERDFLGRVRTQLYSPMRHLPPDDPARQTSLTGVVEIIREGDRLGHRLRAVVTLNYDDLLETRLVQAGIRCTPIYDDSRPSADGLPVYHVHGYLPQEGEIPQQALIFTENSYHEITASMFHWSVKRIMRHLQRHTVLFVGVSMTDPNLRRLLDACHERRSEPQHFAVLEDYVLAPGEVPAAAAEIDARAARYRQQMGRRAVRDPPDPQAATADMCRKAREYQRKMLRSLGVRAVWIRDFDDIPLVLRCVWHGLP